MPFTLDQLDFLGVHVGVAIPPDFIENKKREVEFKHRRAQFASDHPDFKDHHQADAIRSVLAECDELAKAGKNFAGALKKLDHVEMLVQMPPPPPPPVADAAPVVPPVQPKPPVKPPTPPATARSKAEEDYDRRKSKTEAALAKLPADDPQLKELKKRLDEANKQAASGNVKAAYHELKRLKVDARRAGSKFAASLSAQDIVRESSSLAVNVDAFMRLITGLSDRTAALLKDIGKQPKGSACKTADEAFEMRKNFSSFEAGARALMAGAGAQRTRAFEFLTAVDVPKQIEKFAHQVSVLQAQKKPPTKELAAVSNTLSQINKNFRLGGKPVTADALRVLFAKHDDDIEAKLAEWRDISKFQKREQEKGEDRFARLQLEEEKRLQAARERFKAAASGDVVLGVTQDKPGKVQPLRRFEAVDFVDDLADEVPEKIDAKKMDEICARAEDKIKALIESEKPNSDVLFDLTLKTTEELEKELAESLGLDLGKCSPDQKKLIKQMAAKTMEKAKATSPNTMSARKVMTKSKKGEEFETAEEITLNGKNYKNPTFLGQGGLGTIFRYEDADNPGTFVVVKSLNDPEQREDMVHELKMHRHAMGGEDGQGHKNVVGMKGVVRGADDSLHMVLDYESGGDLQKVSHSVKAVADSGVIPEGARTAINQYFFKQAVSGMKHVQDQNMTHHDIKDMNYLVSEDGTVKVADFGSAQVSKEKSRKVKGRDFPTTPVYEAPEIGQETVTGKADTYTLGTMLETLTGASQGSGKRFKGQFEKSAQPVTTLDRLKNAMLDKDPDKRPTLEAVEFSAYLDDASQNHPEEQIKELIQAAMEYSKKAGGEILELQKNINFNRAYIERETKGNAKPSKQITGNLAKNKAEIVAWEKQIEAINNRDDVKPLIEKLKQLGESFK